ncbi:hypothetical protein [Hyphomicrobium sp. CS1BSMeth3]|uniref:hypothetical protein n=1 Tax=Hyphomicrobium sp. CS1BSMeth3 TaxID=1892844 RepID=UPI0011603240|nr:hypothetical protein [Hyphomicrobium sp. CS1BSMeth3]
MVNVQHWMHHVRLAGLIALIWSLAAPASAIEPRKDEKDRLKACEKSLCTLIVAKKPVKGDLQCPLSKAWSKKTMKEGSGSKLRWGFGAAKCEVDLKVPRETIVGALSAAEIKVTLPPHTVDCEVERENSVDKAQITLAPIIELKDGKAKKIWVNVTDIKAPGVIKGVVWSAAQLEDSVGLFHRRMIKAVNKFIREECPKVVAGG